jgi:hypothetical protein
MPNKFNRTYLWTVDLTPNSRFQPNDSIIQIQPPMTVELDITRNTLASKNVASIRVYNLSQNTRNPIRFNNGDTQLGVYKALRLQAGYGPINTQTLGVSTLTTNQGAITSNLPVIFEGDITLAYSVREGVNFVTVIECLDGAFASANGFVNQSVAGNSSVKSVLTDMVSNLPSISVGAIGNFQANTAGRGQAISGNTCQILQEWSGQGFFIDRSKAYLLGQNEYVNDSGPVVVNSAAGLLNTPVREISFLDFDIIFEPNVHPGRAVQLQSSTDPIFNGLKKITSVKHRGMISPAVCGELITSIRTDLTGDDLLTPVNPP